MVGDWQRKDGECSGQTTSGTNVSLVFGIEPAGETTVVTSIVDMMILHSGGARNG